MACETAIQIESRVRGSEWIIAVERVGPSGRGTSVAREDANGVHGGRRRRGQLEQHAGRQLVERRGVQKRLAVRRGLVPSQKPPDSVPPDDSPVDEAKPVARSIAVSGFSQPRRVTIGRSPAEPRHSPVRSFGSNTATGPPPPVLIVKARASGRVEVVTTAPGARGSR